MNLKTYMVLCVTCFLNWAVTAYRLMQTITKRLPISLKKTTLINSISGIFNSIKKTTNNNNNNNESTSALNMVAITPHNTPYKKHAAYDVLNYLMNFKHQSSLSSNELLASAHHVFDHTTPTTTSHHNYDNHPIHHVQETTDLTSTSYFVAGFMEYDPKTAAIKSYRTTTKHTRTGTGTGRRTTSYTPSSPHKGWVDAYGATVAGHNWFTH